MAFNLGRRYCRGSAASVLSDTLVYHTAAARAASLLSDTLVYHNYAAKLPRRNISLAASLLSDTLVYHNEAAKLPRATKYQPCRISGLRYPCLPYCRLNEKRHIIPL